MKRETFITPTDGKEISIAVWDEVQNPKGVVQILHGMAEHIGRYDEFALALNGIGFIVVGDDHRGHGLTDKDNLGKNVDGGDMFEKTVMDAIALTDTLKNRYGLPVVLFGHSYGSFLAQRYLNLSPTSLSGAVLCGSALMPNASVKLGAFVAKIKSRKKGDEKGKFFAKITFAQYNKKFEGTPACWLNRNKWEVDAYRDDALSGYTCSNAFYYSFFSGLKRVYKDKNALIPKTLPLLIMSGSQDAVGGKNAKNVKKLHTRYKKLGLNPTLKLYEGARHEILKEINKAEVICDTLKFIDQAIK